jgi:hypothetical protein
MHTGFNGCRLSGGGVKFDEYAYYLFTTRHVVDRITSWFAYEHPHGNKEDVFWDMKEPLFMQCYDTLELLATEGLAVSDADAESRTVCQRRAVEAIKGLTRFCSHNFYNYGYYMDNIPREARSGKVVVIRTEHLVEDWNSVENILDGAPIRDPNFTFAQKNKTWKKDEILKVDAAANSPAETKKVAALSPQAVRNLCQYLCVEIQRYKEILQRAINLSEEDVAVSMAELQATCPDEPYQIRVCHPTGSVISDK